MATTQASPLREMRIQAVQNGFVVFPRAWMNRDYGMETDCYVFATVEQMAAWMLAQAWQLGDAAHG